MTGVQRLPLRGGAPPTEERPAADLDVEEYLHYAVDRTVDRMSAVDPPAMALSIALTHVANAHVRAAENRVHAEKGRSYLAYRVLSMIWLFEPVEAKDLARIAEISRQTMSSILAKFEADGLITRERNSPNDRRLVEVRLTPTGRREAELSIIAQNTAMKHWLEALDDDEQELLFSMLRRLRANA